MRTAKRFAVLALALTSMLGAAAGCSYRNPVIDRAVNPYWEKTDFNPQDSWYYTTTVVESAPNAGMWGGPGDGEFLVLERVRFEITENQLIGWRDYAAAPGTEVDSLEGGDQVFKGQPVAIFAITDHFDLRKSYDTLSGEESNEILENRERPWYDREYIRVNWNENLMQRTNWRVPALAVGDTWVVQENNPGDPKRWRFDFDQGYFEITTRAAYEPDIYAVLGLYGMGHYYDFAAAVIDVRHSFMKVDKNNDYIPLNMPDSVVRVDANGEEIRDERGEPERVKIFDRFGYFTTWDRAVWHPERGFTAFGEQNFAVRFNIWEKNRDADGMELPLADRTPKPMVWYTNQRHPDQLWNAAQRVADEWNLAFKDTVFHAQPGKYANLDEVPDMFVLRENSCNDENVSTVLAGLPSTINVAVREAAKTPNFDGSIDSVVTRIAWANSPDNDDFLSTRTDLEAQAKSDLERICSALEYFTSAEKTGSDPAITPFLYERVGDLRYNMLNGIVEKTTAGWLGVATLLADPLTGEEIKATANLSISSLDRWAWGADEALRAMDGELEITDILYGYDIERFTQQKLAESREFATIRSSEAMRSRMDQRFQELGAGDQLLKEIPRDHSQQQLNKLAGSRIEEVLLSDDDMVGYGQVDLGTLADFNGDYDAAMLDRVSPLRNRFEGRKPGDLLRQFDEMGKLGIEPIEFIDQMAFGAAMRYRNLSSRERQEKIREDLYVGVQLHEVGHTLGLRHNFEASTDAINYGPDFWRMQAIDPDLDNALGETLGSADQEVIQACIDYIDGLRAKFEDNTITMTTQECLGQNQHMYSTIMEYNGHWAADIGGLKPYDFAAIKFGYAQLVEVFDQPTTANRTEKEVDRWSRLNDWRDIPSDVAPTKEALYARSYVPFAWDHATTSMELPADTVPYRFCTDMYSTDTCIRWDFGPDARTNAAYDIYNYHQRYFFTHFAHDKYWDATSGFWGFGSWWGAVSKDWGIMSNFTEKMRWYYYRKATDPEFTGSYAEEDLLATTVMGLNHIGHVLAHPAPGDYLTVPQYWVEGLTDDDPLTADRLAPTDIMRPYAYFDYCDAIAIAEVEEIQSPASPEPIAVPTGAQPGYTYGKVALGDGRPFALGYNNTDSEEWVITYVGTYYAKDYALYSLGDSAAWFPRTDFINDPRSFYVSWYRLFPNEVGKLVNNYVTEKYADLGPVVDTDGNIIQRDMIDINTGEAPDYTGMSRISPLVSFNNQYYAAVYSLALMSTPYDGQYDMSNHFLIAAEGAADDLGLFESLANDPATADKVVEFEHPVSGRRVRAVDNGVNAIAADLVRRANQMKERFQVLDECVAGTRNPATTPYCQCAGTYRTATDPNGDKGFSCSAPFLEAPGTGSCGTYELVNRRDFARERMDDMSDFIDDIRLVRSYYSNGY
jgi:hypothetical protein